MNDYRLRYHLMPKTGWLNDPNGLCRHNETIHIYYQADPQSITGKHKSWGHFTTKDYIHYKDCGIAIAPEEAFEKDGAYSGSALVIDDKLHAFYTGNVKEAGIHDYVHSGRQHNTIHAQSDDGKIFSKKEVLLWNHDYPDFCSCHVRDPKVNPTKEGYEMVLGARTKEDEGCVLHYVSKDALHWSLKEVYRSPHSMGYMWECPDLLHFDENTLLLCCPQGLTQEGYHYENVYDNGIFVIEGNQALNYKTLDYGFDFYAPQTFQDNNRRILIGWMGMPDADYHNPTKTWMHALTLPRELHYQNGRLTQQVIEEVRRNEIKQYEGLKTTTSSCLRIQFHPKNSFTMTINQLKISWENKLFTLDCSLCGEGRTERHLSLTHCTSVEIYLDTSSIEIFINEGAASFTSRYFDSQVTRTIQSNCQFEVYQLQPITIESE